MNWADFAKAAPELAALGREAFEEQHLSVLVTLRLDGAGYISFGKGRQAMRWTAATGLERLRHPDD